jgi:hypothetical protein
MTGRVDTYVPSSISKTRPIDRPENAWRKR